MNLRKKLLLSTLVITEFFRLLDVIINWGFLSTHTGYVTFLAVDLIFIALGLFAILLLRSPTLLFRSALALYAIFGLGLTFLDPDFTHFATEPVQFMAMEVPATLLFTAGLGTLLTMLIVYIVRLPEKGGESLGRTDGN